MQADGFDSKINRVEEIPKPKRGRPKKQDQKPDPDPEVERKVQTRSQGNRTGAVAGIHSLFQTPCLTKSPTKIRKKVGVPQSLTIILALNNGTFEDKTSAAKGNQSESSPSKRSACKTAFVSFISH
jgi:hypothetical protein